MASEQSLTDPRPYIYTTIGDMARDSRTLGYGYQRPDGADLSRTDYEEYNDHLWVVFENVLCTHDSYSIDLFINQPNPKPKDATLKNQNYMGQILRLGMGTTTNKDRCVTEGVTRIVDASYTANALSLTPSSPISIDMIVINVTTHEVCSPEDYQKKPGFIPVHSWGPSLVSARKAILNQKDTTGCPHCQTN